MKSVGSVQLRAFRIAVRDGLPIEAAAANAGFTMEEARLTIKADALEPPPPEAFVLNPAPGSGVTLGVENMEDIEEEDNAVVTLASDTLRGDVRDALLSWVRSMPKNWSAMDEAEQRDIADGADRCARTLVKEACKLIAANERPCIVATLVEYKEKDGVEAKLKLPSRGEVISALHEACGREVLVVTSGAEEFLGEAAPAVIDPDRPELPLGQEYDDAVDQVIEDVNNGSLGPNVTASRGERKAA